MKKQTNTTEKINLVAIAKSATNAANKVKPQMKVVEFMSVDKKPLESVEFDVLMADKVAEKIYSYNPTPEAMAKVAKEYADVLELKNGTGKVVYIAE